MQGYNSIVKPDQERAARYAALTEGFKDQNRRMCLEFTLDVMLSRLAKGGKVPSDAVRKIFETRDLRTLEAIVTTDIATPIKQLFPIVTRTYWSLRLLDLIATQPMGAPSGKIFYQDFRYVSPGGLYDPGIYAPGARTDKYIDPEYAVSVEMPGNTVREIGMTITSANVSAETRRLNAQWSDEVEQDLMAYFGIPMDSLMVRNLGDEIAREIDQDGLDKLVAGATAGNVNWASTPAGVYATLDPQVWGGTLWDALIDADQLVWEAINRSTTWIVGNATTINRLRKLGGHQLVGGNEEQSAQAALVYSGLFGERWKVYCARHFPAGKLLLGYQGSDFSDTGAIYSPFVPLEVKDAVKDLRGTNAYSTIRGVQTRGQTVIVNGDAFATVTVT